jgi:hypothetical protein
MSLGQSAGYGVTSHTRQVDPVNISNLRCTFTCSSLAALVVRIARTQSTTLVSSHHITGTTAPPSSFATAPTSSSRTLLSLTHPHCMLSTHHRLRPRPPQQPICAPEGAQQAPEPDPPPSGSPPAAAHSPLPQLPPRTPRTARTPPPARSSQSHTRAR